KVSEVRGRLDTECFVFAIRKDRPKFKRVRELMDINSYTKACTKLKFSEDAATYYNPTS
ncbi:unnamed protein product, partial [Choristocarpus tenellus]